MTAYKTRKAALAVTTGLVGALTLAGAVVAVPAAYAEDAELTSVQPGTSLSDLTADNGYGENLALVDGQTVELTANSKDYVRVTAVSGKKIASQTFYNDNGRGEMDNTVASRPLDKSAGKAYWLVVKTTDGAEYRVRFEYKAAPVAKVTYKVEGSYSYTGNGVWPALKGSDGKVYVDSTASEEAKDAADGIVSWSNITKADGTNQGYDAAVNAGTYKGTYTLADGTTGEATFTISSLDLNEFSHVFPEYVTNVSNGSDVYAPADAAGFFAEVGLNAADFEVVSVDGPSGFGHFGGVKGDKSGTYTVSFKAKGSVVQDGNASGTGKVSYTVLDRSIAGDKSAQYGVTAPENTYTVDQTQGQAFDASKVKFVGTDKKTYTGDAIEVSYTTLKGQPVDASALKETGKYTVTVRLKPVEVDGKLVGGTDTFTLVIAGAQIDANAGLTFTKDGEVVADNAATSKAGVNVDYDGSDVLKAISTEVKDSDGKVYEAGKDYKVVATNAATGEEVDSIVDAGTYKVTVVPVTFDKSGADADWQLTVEVNKATIETLKDFGATTYDVWSADGNDVVKPGLKADFSVVYTGAEQDVPAAQFYKMIGSTGHWATDADNALQFGSLSADDYEVTSVTFGGKKVEKLKDAGDYKVNVRLTAKGSKNLTLRDSSFTVTVKKASSFADVDPTAWYASPVEKAYKNYYVNGISGTQLFAPMADITRADAVCILFNMAGGEQSHGDDEFSYTEDKGYNTGFSDVDGKAYYAKAIAWAKASGVANGYGDGTFKPAAQITREEFAAFLMNYAKSSDRYEAPSSDALSGVSDAGTVSAWAEDAVNWAVSEKVMGNGGFVAGQSRITRAEVAAMGVNFQPEALVEIGSEEYPER